MLYIKCQLIGNLGSELRVRDHTAPLEQRLMGVAEGPNSGGLIELGLKPPTF